MVGGKSYDFIDRTITSLKLINGNTSEKVSASINIVFKVLGKLAPRLSVYAPLIEVYGQALERAKQFKWEYLEHKLEGNLFLIMQRYDMEKDLGKFRNII